MDSEGRNSASSVAESAAAPPPPESTAPPQANPPDRDQRTTEEVFQTLHLQFRELLDYLVYYIASRIDAVKFYIKRRILWMAMVALGVLAGAGAIVTAVVLLCEGIADSLSALFGRRWAGELATGVLLLGATVIIGYFALNNLISQSHRERVAKFEEFRARHRQRYGHDVADRAHQHGEGGGHA